ncbi:MAG: hypothetical protein P8M73_09010 [Luminiphilus sp.]|nr:hypothetical protein [Luminiphilus sp.]
MNNGYGPALLLGVIIGGAIIADDFVRPHPPHRQQGPRSVATLPAPPASDQHVWIMKGEAHQDMEVHKEMRIVLEDDRGDSGQESVMVIVKVEDHSRDEEATGTALADKVREVVEEARAEGREPTEAEIEAAIEDIAGGADHVEIDIQSE